jgi:hypothetical protein
MNDATTSRVKPVLAVRNVRVGARREQRFNGGELAVTTRLV